MEAVISIVGSILGSLAGKAVEYTVDPIARQFSYLFKPKTKFQNLRGQLQQLKDARERVQQNVNQAIRQGEDIYDNVNRWLTEVNGKISEEAAAQFKHDEEKAKQSPVTNSVAKQRRRPTPLLNSWKKKADSMEYPTHLNQKEFFSGKLERFKISIGEKWGWSEDNLETSRNLKLKLNKSIHNLYDIGIKTLLRKAENLYLNGVADAMDMLYDPDIEGFSHLKHLYVRNDSEVKYIINSVKLVSCKVVFPVLESLMLYDLMKLEAICDGQVLKAGYFGRLKIIKVEDCKKLKNLFSFAIARELSQVLEEIEVYKCESCTELIVEKREEDDDNIVVEFRQLRSLKLFHLPNFKGVFYSEKRHSSSQQDARRVESTTATSLFDPKPKVVFPKLKKLHLYSIDIEKLWDDHQLHVTSSSVQNLTSLTVTYCDNLKNLFTSSMVTSFVQLERLVVEDCYKMEEVIIVNEGEEERMRKIVFPKLQELKLDNLQNMKRFCFGNYPIEFPFLRKLWIERCPVFNTFHSDSTTTIVGNEAVTVESLLPHVPKYLFTDKVSLPMLEYLRIYALGNLERLWPNKLVDDSFSKLTHFELKYCKLLKNVFPLSMLTTLQRLNQLSIWSCDSLEEIFESQEEGSSSNSTTHHLVHENIAFGFPQLG
ncbi:hypothetical protein PTKIN_Ptkin06aG0157800 [Pterospermum kingtungense]